MEKFISQEELNTIKEFLETEGEKILCYHQDADGVCSAALILKFFPHSEALLREGPKIEPQLIEKFIKSKPKLILFVDLPVDQEAEKIRKIKKQLPDCKILIIDHHIPEVNLTGKGILHINPRFNRNVYWPASYLIYQILYDLGKKVDKFMWIGAIGVIGDYGFDTCKEFISDCKKAYPKLMFGHPLISNLGKGAEIISAAITLKGLFGAKKALRVLVKAENYVDFAFNKDLVSWHRYVKEKINNIITDFDKNKEEYPEVKVYSYEIKSKLNISSVVSSILARNYPENIIIIRKKFEHGFKLSLRYQAGKINIGEAVKNAVHDIGSGGGHEKAAGALVKDWNEFKKRFFRELKLKQNK